MAKKKKSGSIAVPFLITVFLGLIILGGSVYAIYTFYFNKEEKPPEPPSRTGTISATAEDRHTILFILDESSNEKLIDKEGAYTFVLMRSLPDKKRLLFVGIPCNSIAVIDGRQQSLKGAYERGGGVGAKDFVVDILGEEIDRYMVFDSQTFKNVCDIFGNVIYPVDADIAGLNGDGSMQSMSAEQIETYVTYSLFANGERDRVFNAAALLSYMINGSDGERISEGFDRYFDEVINSVPSTDITAVDYDKLSSAIKYLFKYGSTPAISIIIDGVDSEGDFIPSSDFIKNLPEEYFSENEEG